MAILNKYDNLVYSVGNLVYSMGNLVYSVGNLVYSMGNLVYSMGNLVYSMGNLVYSMGNLVYYMGNLVYSMAIWYILWTISVYFSVLNCHLKKYLATESAVADRARVPPFKKKLVSLRASLF
jgi:hypothetical protein